MAKKALARAVPAAAPPAISLDDPNLYVNRELSLLEFQRRVLAEAEDESHPLLERVKFLSILGSNLDEFFMVRVAGLQNQVDAGIHEPGADGMTPHQQLQAIQSQVNTLMADALSCLQRRLRDLANHGIRILDYKDLDGAQRDYAAQYFRETVYPCLTPLAYDPGRPFPHISNLSLSLSVLIRDERGEGHFARLKVPDTLPQLVPLQKVAKGNGRPLTFVWLEQVIQANLHDLFPGMDVLESHLFHLTRDADTSIQELEAEDLLETVEEGVRRRRFGSVVRLQVNPEMPDGLLDILRSNLELQDYDIYRSDGPLALSRLRGLAALDRPELKDPPFVPVPLTGLADDEDIFGLIRRHDVLVHHPFDSFQPVVDFIRSAANDPNVLAIKMTLYRVGRNSPVVEALLQAQENGKQVAVLVELKARFDEESNIGWARKLEEQGVHVVYGLVGLKIHAKVALVVRREGEVIRRYVHLSTGNYNAVTAHLYTDMGFFTNDPEIGADATDLFNYLTGYSAKSDYKKLLVAPVNMRKRLQNLIARETSHARAGREARIVFKVNALVDPKVIRMLYEASQAGVQIDLLVRGICCLRPGVQGVSDNIRVRSIVGRFLEHSRVFYFLNCGEEELYLGSADLMPRNIDRRVEVLFPIQRLSMIRYIHKVLAIYLNDNVKSWLMQPGGSYARAVRAKGERAVSSQMLLLDRRNAKTAG